MTENRVKVATVSDTGVYPAGDGYEFLQMVTGWHPDNPRRLARVYVRVDRQPSESWADVDLWTRDHGWQSVIVFGPLRFWNDMPGFDRPHAADTKRLMRRLTEQMIAELLVLADTSDI